MTDAFDPYHKWLGIRPEEQPPDHYRLLGVPRFEKDPDVITHAADQRMAHVRTFQAGKHSALSQEILNKISAARVCLADPQKKAEYDRRLRATMKRPEQSQLESPSRAVSASASADPLPRIVSDSATPMHRVTSGRKKPAWQIPATVGGALLLVVVLLLWGLSGGDDAPVARNVELPTRTVPLPPPAPSDTKDQADTSSLTPPPVPSTEEAKPEEPEDKTPPAVAPDEPEQPEAPAEPDTTMPEPEPPAPVVEPEEPPASGPPADEIAPDRKSPIPEADAIKEAEQIFREVYGDDLAKAKKPADKGVLAKRFFEQTDSADDDPVGQFVLLSQAAQLAAEAGMSGLVLKAVDRQAESFAIDPWQMKIELLEKAAGAPVTNSLKVPLAKDCLTVIDGAVAAERFDAAQSLGRVALVVVRRARDRTLTKTIVQRVKELETIKAGYERAAAAKKTLAENPDDPAANTAWGTYLIAVRHDWSAGLPLLAKSDNAALADIAKKDLARPTDLADRVALADGWYDLGKNADRESKGAYESRAVWWYLQVRAEVDGLAKVRVEKRLGSINVATLHAIPPDIGIANPDAVPVGEMRQYEFRGRFVHCLAVTPDGRRMAAVGSGGDFCLWETASGRELIGKKVDAEGLIGLAISRDGRYAACGGYDKNIHIFDLKTLKEVSQITTVAGKIMTLAFSADGRFVLSASWSGGKSTCLWNVANKQMVWHCARTGSFIHQVNISPDGRLAITGGTDKVAHLIDMASGQEARALKSRGSYIETVTFTPNGRRAISAGEDAIARVWDIETGREIGQLQGHEQRVTEVAVSGSSRYALSVSIDSTVRLWDLESGQEVQRWDERCYRVAFLPDERFAVLAYGRTVRLWRLPISKSGRVFKRTTEAGG